MANSHDSGNELSVLRDKNKEAMQAGATLEDGCIEVLIEHWRVCIDELQRLQQAAIDASYPIGGLYSLLKTQQRALDRISQKQTGQKAAAISPAQYFGVKSCCWDDRWRVLKKSQGLVHINKEFPRSPRLPVPPGGSGWLAYKDNPFQEKTVTVDAVVDSGATWIKFISISTRTLEYQIVAEGWDSEASEDEDDDAAEQTNKEEAGEGGLAHTEFADSIHKLVLAAQWNHCPHIHLILSGLQEGKSDVIDKMLAFLRTQGGGTDIKVTVSCANSLFLTETPPPADTAIAALVNDRDETVGDACSRITPTANLDPSALVSLVTDLHHGPVSLQPEFQQKIIAQSVLDHDTDNSPELVSRQDILATVLYPALRGHKLVCTRFAAKYFRQLISAISTSSEELRSSLILPPFLADTAMLSEENIRRELQKWSNVPVPDDLHLPVQIVDDIELDDVAPLIAAGKLPLMAAGVADDLSRLNRSVYLYGWANRLTTITGHRGIERQIQLSIATHWTPDGLGLHNERPPDIFHRHLGGYLIHRDKPKEWRSMVLKWEDIPAEVVRWANPWTTWGRGISTYGLPDTRTWDGVGHDDKTAFGRRSNAKEQDGKEEQSEREKDGEEP
ncbi:hypothetical protein B0H63DRAFT_489192 [Podospora didyma]|uniref:DUF1308 domain-containing protein n=1 Tax=Podospora didyma TaxID=330526 RepID=A0AAE0K395_9PEZI|nr:hypothetical protein B0H63DRAFT_489192 [Podospora didyma]